MNIFRASLRVRDTAGLGKFNVEMFLQKRPTHADIVQRMKAKIDTEIVSDEQPTLMWILQEIQKYPLKDDKNNRMWLPDLSKYPSAMPTGSTSVFEIFVIEN